MADFYEEMRGVAEELLAPTSENGLGQVGVVLFRKKLVPPMNSWDMPTYTTHRYTLKAAAKGVSQELVGAPGAPSSMELASSPGAGGAVIVSTDLEVIFTPPPGGVQAGDTLTVNGVAVSVLLLRAVPAAGVVVVYKAVVRAGQGS